MHTNKNYEIEINALIPTAEKEARERVNEYGITSIRRQGKDDFYNHCFKTQFFHEAMKRLAIEAGLRKF